MEKGGKGDRSRTYSILLAHRGTFELPTPRLVFLTFSAEQAQFGIGGFVPPI